ncbi:MAG: hypothetical protein JNM57_09350 [Cyclobacteriaceae bacterium]|nr:hypothetical protein [Cyclobacteriaceae bacterium]
MKGIFCAVLFFTLLSCSPGSKEIRIDVKPGPKVYLNDQHVDMVNFEKKLQQEVSSLTATGYPKEKLVIELTVDPETKRGILADIETSMRRLNLRKISYHVKSTTS